MTNRIIVLLLIIQIAALPAWAAMVEVEQTTKCQVIERHVPDADVAYQPDRDVVAGKPVAPADLPVGPDGAAQIVVPQNFDIEIDADLAGGVAGAQDPAPYLPRAKIGRVEVRDLEGQTRLDFNGQPLYRGASGTASLECAQ
ncbi:MAG: hypothetical protein ACOY15_05540 [Pseudomonadota bacterium]